MCPTESVLCTGSPEPSLPAPRPAALRERLPCSLTQHAGGSYLLPFSSGATLLTVHRPDYIFQDINGFPFISPNIQLFVSGGRSSIGHNLLRRPCDLWLSAVIPVLRPLGAQCPLKHGDFLIPGDFPRGSDGTNICLQCRRPGFDPWVEKIPWRRKWQPTPVFLPGKFHGQSSLVDYSP